MNDLRTQRDRQAYQNALYDNDQPPDKDCSISMLATLTVDDAYPVGAASYFAANPTVVTGNEVEGGAATYTADTSTVMYVLNEGTSTPPVGTVVIAHLVGGRWMMRFDG